MRILDKLISISKAAKMLGVGISTLRIWDSEGRLKAVRTVGGHRRYFLSDIQKAQGLSNLEVQTPCIGSASVAVYCRVSSHKQKKCGDLDRQKGRILSYCINKGYHVIFVLEEVSSGMSDSRPKLKKLFNLVSSGEISHVVVEHKDRLTRFMFRIFEYFFASHGVTLECIEDVLGKSYEEELALDMLALMSSFSARIYGRRSAHIRRNKKAHTNAETESV